MQSKKPSLIFILFMILLASTIPAAKADSQANKTLLEAASPYEDMLDFAMARDNVSIRRALATADRQAATVKAVLSAAAAADFDARLQGIHQAVSEREYQHVAVAAVAVYGILLEGLQPGKLLIPKEVSLLDYAGFKLRVLAAETKPDWKAMRKTTEDASTWWKSLKPGVSNIALRDAFSTVVTGLQQATEEKNLSMLRLAAQMDLDLVDLLENHFSRKR